MILSIIFLIGSAFLFWFAFKQAPAKFVKVLHEADYIKRLAPKYKAEMEVVLDDGSRADLVNDNYAMEVDYAAKWKEAIGQAEWYAERTNKKPGIILLVKNPGKEWRYLWRCAYTCGKLGIKLYIEEV